MTRPRIVIVGASGHGRVAPSRMNGLAQHARPLEMQLDQRICAECQENPLKVPSHQLEQRRRPNVAGPNEQELEVISSNEKRIIKIRVLRDNHPPLLDRHAHQRPVHAPVTFRQLARMNGIMACSAQEDAKPNRKMRIHQEPHVNTRCWLRTLRDLAAKSRHASRSSRCRSGNSSSRSSSESPAARYSKRLSTGYRNPRMTGLPWHTSGSMVIRFSMDAIPEPAASAIELSMNRTSP